MKMRVLLNGFAKKGMISYYFTHTKAVVHDVPCTKLSKLCDSTVIRSLYFNIPRFCSSDLLIQVVLLSSFVAHM